MDYIMVLRFLALLTIVFFAAITMYERFSFSYVDPSRRYRYQRRHPGDDEYETRGSSWFLRPALKHLTSLPRYVGEPQRIVWDSKKDRIVWDSVED